jgi:hypothetical protein
MFSWQVRAELRDSAVWLELYVPRFLAIRGLSMSSLKTQGDQSLKKAQHNTSTTWPELVLNFLAHCTFVHITRIQ